MPLTLTYPLDGSHVCGTQSSQPQQPEIVNYTVAARENSFYLGAAYWWKSESKKEWKASAACAHKVPAVPNCGQGKANADWAWKSAVEGKQINDLRFWKKDFWRKLDLNLWELRANLYWVKVGCNSKLVWTKHIESPYESRTPPYLVGSVTADKTCP